MRESRLWCHEMNELSDQRGKGKGGGSGGGGDIHECISIGCPSDVARLVMFRRASPHLGRFSELLILCVLYGWRNDIVNKQSIPRTSEKDESIERARNKPHSLREKLFESVTRVSGLGR